MTHTYAILEVPSTVYAAVRALLERANYEHTFGTAGYMKAAKDFTESTRHLVKKGAFLGIIGPKVFLLKGITFFIDVDFKTFDSEHEALEWLVS